MQPQRTVSALPPIQSIKTLTERQKQKVEGLPEIVCATDIRRATALIVLMSGGIEMMICAGGWEMQGITNAFRYITFPAEYCAYASNILAGISNVVCIIALFLSIYFLF